MQTPKFNFEKHLSDRWFWAALLALYATFGVFSYIIKSSAYCPYDELIAFVPLLLIFLPSRLRYQLVVLIALCGLAFYTYGRVEESQAVIQNQQEICLRQFTSIEEMPDNCQETMALNIQKSDAIFGFFMIILWGTPVGGIFPFTATPLCFLGGLFAKTKKKSLRILRNILATIMVGILAFFVYMTIALSGFCGG